MRKESEIDGEMMGVQIGHNNTEFGMFRAHLFILHHCVRPTADVFLLRALRVLIILQCPARQ